ncbi:hypothetical protein D3C86_1661090 [compost metagenome]
MVWFINVLMGNNTNAPINTAKKTGLRIALLKDCMARMYSRSGIWANPGITEQDHAKKTPADNAAAVAVIINKMVDIYVFFISAIELS